MQQFELGTPKKIAYTRISPMLSPLPRELIAHYFLEDMNNAELWRNRRVSKGWQSMIMWYITQETSEGRIFNLGARIYKHLTGGSNPVDLSLIGKFDFHFRFFMPEDQDNSFLAQTSAPVYNVLVYGGSNATWAELKLDFWLNCLLAAKPPKLYSTARCKMVTNLDHLQIATTGEACLSPTVSFKTQRKDYETGVTASYEAALGVPLYTVTQEGIDLPKTFEMHGQIWEDKEFWEKACLKIEPSKVFSSDRTKVYIDLDVKLNEDLPNSVVFYEDDLQTGYGYETRFIYSNFYKVEDEARYDWIAHEGNGLKDNYRKAIMEEDLMVWKSSLTYLFN